MKIITHPYLYKVEEIDGFTTKIRHSKICEYLKKMGLIDSFIPNISKVDLETILLQIHSEKYINSAKSNSAYIPGIYYFEIVISQAREMVSGKSENIFCIGFPAGHHAEKDWNVMEGFCLFNNVCGAAKILSERYKNILIIDFDVHQGNGTKDIIKGEEGINLISLQGKGLYPLYSNEDIQQENYLGIDYHIDDNCSVVISGIMKSVDNWNPDFILISAGFDAHNDDPFSPTHFTEDDYQKIGAYLKTLNIPVMAILEGGYDYIATAKSIEVFAKDL